MAKLKFTKNPEVVEVIQWDGNPILPAELRDSPHVKVVVEGGFTRMWVTSEKSQTLATPGDYLEPSTVGFKVHEKSEFESTHTKKA